MCIYVSINMFQVKPEASSLHFTTILTSLSLVRLFCAAPTGCLWVHDAASQCIHILHIT